ncbi:hypothetical protein [Pseudoramibacter sp.]|jgi:precorrin isomerase|uniref:hypothetical protein n=1 Tax=Pseudoramibacter sp. TaxID=2034862 RepID=UPI0025EC1514|nr:hypothetical protein [Pseudoramibacter sp.]MCH4071573.1 hypothetical protein [Pseudoramibacter sp.]MCH4105341.1 hypothetical protein [Pseudoramibacter sp.]
MSDPVDSKSSQNFLSFLEFDDAAKEKDDAEFSKSDKDAKEAALEKKRQILTDAYLTSRGLDHLREHAEEARAVAREIVDSTEISRPKKKHAQKAAERAHLKACVEQNWLIIEQNDTLIATLKQLDQDLRTATRYLGNKINLTIESHEPQEVNDENHQKR